MTSDDSLDGNIPYNGNNQDLSDTESFMRIVNEVLDENASTYTGQRQGHTPGASRGQGHRNPQLGHGRSGVPEDHFSKMNGRRVDVMDD